MKERGNRGLRFALLAAGCCGFLAANPALADCTGPAGVKGAIDFVSASNKFTYCNGSIWRDMGALTGGSGPAHGYFVISQTTYNGNMGGLSGANGLCLTELTNRNWMGKTDASARGLITAAKVRAFLCDKTTCNNLQPSTGYRMATAGAAGSGGAAMIADASGLGPNNLANWDDLGTFDIWEDVWTNRSGTDDHVWGATPEFTTDASTCNGWTTASSSVNGPYADTNSATDYRWNYVTTQGCDEVLYMICIVNP